VCSSDIALAFSRFCKGEIIFWLPLVAAALVLHPKTPALNCVADNAAIEIFYIVGNIFSF